MEFQDLKVEVPLDEEKYSTPLFDVPVKKYQNNDGDFVTGFDVTSEEAERRRLKRAKRFGIVAQPTESQHKPEAIPSSLDELPKARQDAEIRPAAILLFGVNEMSTKDVFDYFKDYMPGSIEWIDDMSCVVVWEDENSAKRAMVSMGTIYTPPQDSGMNQDELLQNIWRIGKKHPKSKQLLMRFATKFDKKAKGARTRSLYYLVHGNPDQQEKAKKRGLVSSSRRRKIRADRQRVQEEINAGAEVEVLDIDMDETMATEMEVDEPPAKVTIWEDSTRERPPRGNMYADQEKNPTKAARLRLWTKSLDETEVFLPDEHSADRYSNSAGIDAEPGAKSETGNEAKVYEKNGQLPDLREKLKLQKQGFNSRTRPNLSIEITED